MMRKHRERTREIDERDSGILDFEQINAYLCNVDWYGSLNADGNIDGKYEMFLAILHHCIDTYVPVIQMPSREIRLPPYLYSMCRRKSKAWKIANACTKANKESLLEEFKVKRDRFEKRLVKYFNQLNEKSMIAKTGKSFVDSRLQQKGRIGAIVGPKGIFA